MDLARFTPVPFGYFFAPEPPAVKLPIPDFRRRCGALPAKPSQDFLQVLYASQERQDWFRDYSVRHGLDPIGFVGTGRDLAPPKLQRASSTSWTSSSSNAAASVSMVVPAST